MSQPRRKKRVGTPQGNEFLDAAREAFVRHLALDRWRDYEALAETLGDRRRALAEAGVFLERGRYHAQWEATWRARVVEAAPPLDDRLFGVIEGAVAAAVAEEVAARQAGGDRPLEEDPEYRTFVDRILGRLFTATAGQLEPFEDGA